MTVLPVSLDLFSPVRNSEAALVINTKTSMTTGRGPFGYQRLFGALPSLTISIPSLANSASLAFIATMPAGC